MPKTSVAPKGFHHVALEVKDFDASVKFYTKALGFEVAHRWDDHGAPAVMLDTGAGDYMELFGRGSDIQQAVSPIVHFALLTDDCDNAITRAREAGAKVTMEPKDVDIPSSPAYPVRIAFCKGPDGELIEFFQER